MDFQPAGKPHSNGYKDAMSSIIDQPIVFEGTIGLYRSASPEVARLDTAVLFVSSWGFEELCARKMWRLLACDLAAQGIASLRFDYPGTGDALDIEDASAGLEIWHRSIAAAAETLKDLSGARRLLLIGHGIGAALAWHAAERITDVCGLAMIAPALQGRQWVREFMALSRIADHGLIEHRVPPTGPMMGEQDIPDQILTDLRLLDYRKPAQSPVSDFLVLTREGRPADDQFLSHLGSLSVNVRNMVFDEYSEFAKDVLFSVPPRKAISAITEWSSALSRQEPAQEASDPANAQNTLSPATYLAGPGFREEPVRFGQDKRLYGMITHPDEAQQGATVMILSTGYDRMSGWGRITTRICRDLAKAGIPSFRFDFSNVADSPPRPDAPDQIIYGDSQLQDVYEALTFLEERRLCPVVATGRCSGGYTAFRSALTDHRIKAVTAANVFDFYIDPNDDIEAIISASLQPLSSYGRKMRNGTFWKRVLKGEVNIRRGVTNLTKMIAAKLSAILLPALVMMPIMTDNRRNRIAGFRKLHSKGVKLSLIYSKIDVGLPKLESSFGKSGYLLRNFIDLDIDLLEEADHNLTTAEARIHWKDKIEHMSKSINL